MGVLVNQSPSFLLDQPLDVERLRNHRADDAEELDAAFIVAFRLELQIDGKGAGGGSLYGDGNADETQLVAREIGTARQPVQEVRLLADARHHNGLAALDDLTRDPLTNLEADGAGAVIEPFDGFHVQLPFTEQGDHATHDAVMSDENLQDALHR